MLTRRVIPCLDVKDGRVVKGVRFAGLRDAGDPADLASEYERQGADEIVMLDVTATIESRETAVETVRCVRRGLALPLTVGGGVRSEQDAAALLEAGADRVAVNTAALRSREIVSRLAARFGSQCVVVAIDARRQATGWEVVVESGRTPTGIDAVEWARAAADLGAGEILLTSWDRDGTQSGYDLDLLNAVAASLTVSTIASGGAAGPEHLLEAIVAGADAVLAASIFHDSRFRVSDLKRYLAIRNIEVRL